MVTNVCKVDIDGWTVMEVFQHRAVESVVVLLHWEPDVWNQSNVFITHNSRTTAMSQESIHTLTRIA